MDNWKKQFLELVKLPVVTVYKSLVMWIEYKNAANQLHRLPELGPAFTCYVSKKGYMASQQYYVNDKKHRPIEDGPASINYNKHGNKTGESYKLHGKKHNIDKPAVIWYYAEGNISYEVYAVNHQIHRLNGPACIEYYKNGQIRYEEYWVKDIRLKICQH